MSYPLNYMLDSGYTTKKGCIFLFLYLLENIWKYVGTCTLDRQNVIDGSVEENSLGDHLC